MSRLARLNTADANFERSLARLLAFEAAQDPAVEDAVGEIIEAVRARGDAAVLDYTHRFDGLRASAMTELEIPHADLAKALARIAPAQREALERAAERIRAYHDYQRLESWSFTEADGSVLGQRVTPLARVGVYVPGGKAAYPSTVLMNVIPAKVAGVAEIIMTVPTPRGERNDLVLAAAALAGVDRVFAIGGAQAVAALAYGTATVPAVDKIVGPGNAYVAAAKRRVFGVVGIDMVAGPSEIVLVCDRSCPPDWIAMDMFSQAEHDEIAQAIAISPDAALLDRIAESIERLLPRMSRRAVIEASLASRGALIATRDLDETCELVNRIAPEHLQLALANADAVVERIRNAGAVFVGPYSSEALGDYCAGPNHVLPTSRSARFSSPLGVYDFQKRSSLLAISRRGADKLGRIAAVLASGEGLSAHARAAEYRLQDD
ncbi:MAG: histidinol dehydrogenase [Burkholderiales bacterium]|nr:histidinol dehydrogenase [Burkholderiales bacterium]